MNSTRPHAPAPAPGSITDVAGIEVGHFTDHRRPTGCSVVIARGGAVAGVDVRGAAPGTRETDLLHPSNLVDQVHAITLAGGSAWGLDAASGVMQWLEEQGIGLNTGYGLVPIVPAAVIFDLGLGDSRIRPDAHAGYQACVAASHLAPAQGNAGAGAGALVGKLYGMALAMKRRRRAVHRFAWTASRSARWWRANAMGDVLDPRQRPGGRRCPHARRKNLDATPAKPCWPGNCRKACCPAPTPPLA